MRRTLLALTVALSVLAVAPSVFACHHGDKARKQCKKPAETPTTQPSAEAVKPEAPAAVAAPAPAAPAAPTAPATTDGKKYKVDDFGSEELPEAGK